jgi:hypothetical protein
MRSKAKWLVVLALAVFCVRLTAGEAENPFKKAKVGDWVSYTMATVASGQKNSSNMKQTVKAKDEKEVTLLVENEMNGQKFGQEVKIPLDKPYDPSTAMAANMKAKVEKLGEGDENVTVGGKQYACHWIQMKVVMGANMTSTSKVWTCPDVPLGGMVKMEAQMQMKMGETSMDTTSTTEMTGAGSQ